MLATETCYRAMESRDRRFEGLFVTAVTSTGIYCRPGCPARVPRRANVRFYPTTAAAAEAGFRPCARCRPELAPELVPRTSRTAARALRLIGSGALGEGGVEGLAARLGVSGRHLRRLLAEHVGASPVAIATTRRAHFARRLLDETALPMREVAAAAGFASVRRFNAVVKDVFRRTPGALRAAAGARPAAGAIEMRVRARAPFDGEGLLAFLAARAIPGVERVEGRRYTRAIELGAERGVLSVAFEEAAGEAPVARVAVALPTSRALLEVVERVRRLLDLGTDPAPIVRHLARDPLLAPLVRVRPGIRVPGAWDPFELLVRAILGQQVTVRAATTLAGRIVARLGAPLDGGPAGVTHLFPTSAALAGGSLDGLGLPGSRIATIKAVAQAVSSGALDLEAPDVERRLREVRGIGPWTASYVAMRALADPDALPAEDVYLRRVVSEGGAGLLTARQLAARGERWRPFRSYATLLLYQSAAELPPRRRADARPGR